MHKRNCRELYVWRESVAFVPDVYAVVEGFPPREGFALADRIRRAAVSVPASIAEGHANVHPREFLRHLRIANGSLAELHTLMVVAEQVGYMRPDALEEIERKIALVSRPLQSLMAVVQGREAISPRLSNAPLAARPLNDAVGPTARPPPP